MEAHISYKCLFCNKEFEEKDVSINEDNGLCCPDCGGELILVIED